MLNLSFSGIMFENNNKTIVYFPNKLRAAHIGYILPVYFAAITYSNLSGHYKKSSC